MSPSRGGNRAFGLRSAYRLGGIGATRVLRCAKRFQRPADLAREDLVHRRLDDLECGEEGRFGVVGAALRAQHETARVQERRACPDVAATDAPLRFVDELVRVIDLALFDEHLGESTLRLDQESLLVRGAEPPHGFPERLLRQGEVAALLVDVREVGQRPPVAAGGAVLVEHLESLTEVVLGLLRLRFAEATPVDGERVAHGLVAAARLGERLGLFQQGDRPGDVAAHSRDGGELRSREAFEVGPCAVRCARSSIASAWRVAPSPFPSRTARPRKPRANAALRHRGSARRRRRGDRPAGRGRVPR